MMRSVCMRLKAATGAIDGCNWHAGKCYMMRSVCVRLKAMTGAICMLGGVTQREMNIKGLQAYHVSHKEVLLINYSDSDYIVGSFMQEGMEYWCG